MEVHYNEEFLAHVLPLARLFAELASTSGDLEEGALRFLMSDYAQASMIYCEVCRMEREGTARQGSVEMVDAAMFSVLPRIQRTARHVIGGLLDGKKIDLVLPSSRRLLTLKDGTLHSLPMSDGLEAALFSEFVAVVTVPQFLFRRCPECSDIFVRNRRQVYCSRNCAAYAFETSRKEVKREYMRKYMAMRRAKARRTAAKATKAQKQLKGR